MPISTVDTPIVSSAATSVVLRPTRSPKWPNTTEPIGRAMNAIANVANDASVAVAGIGCREKQPRKDQHRCGRVNVEVEEFDRRADQAREQDLARRIEGLGRRLHAGKFTRERAARFGDTERHRPASLRPTGATHRTTSGARNDDDCRRHRRHRRTPPPKEPSVLGRASLTVNARPPRSWPFNWLIAVCASSSLRHLDEREAARAAGGHVAHHFDALDGSGLREQVLQLSFRRVVRQVSDIKFLTHNTDSLRRACDAWRRQNAAAKARPTRDRHLGFRLVASRMSGEASQ